MADDAGRGNALLNDVRGAAAEYLRLMGGMGRNREHVSALRGAVDLAVAQHESRQAARAEVRPGELPSDDPVWEKSRSCGG